MEQVPDKIRRESVLPQMDLKGGFRGECGAVGAFYKSTNKL